MAVHVGEEEVVLPPGVDVALGGHAPPPRARPVAASGARSPSCGGEGQRRFIGEEDVAGALIDAAVRDVVGVIVKLTPGDVVVLGECCGEMFYASRSCCSA